MLLHTCRPLCISWPSFFHKAYSTLNIMHVKLTLPWRKALLRPSSISTFSMWTWLFFPAREKNIHMAELLRIYYKWHLTSISVLRVLFLSTAVIHVAYRVFLMLKFCLLFIKRSPTVLYCLACVYMYRVMNARGKSVWRAQELLLVDDCREQLLLVESLKKHSQLYG